MSSALLGGILTALAVILLLCFTMLVLILKR